MHVHFTKRSGVCSPRADWIKRLLTRVNSDSAVISGLQEASAGPWWTGKDRISLDGGQAHIFRRSLSILTYWLAYDPEFILSIKSFIWLFYTVMILIIVRDHLFSDSNISIHCQYVCLAHCKTL